MMRVKLNTPAGWIWFTGWIWFSLSDLDTEKNGKKSRIAPAPPRWSQDMAVLTGAGEGAAAVPLTCGR